MLWCRYQSYIESERGRRLRRRGYRPENDLLFRNSCGERYSSSTHQFSNENGPHGAMPKSILLCDLGKLNWPEIESLAVQIFISDYCISSSDRAISRGYLNGLESLIEKARLGLNIAKSYKIISLANLGKKAASPMLLQNSTLTYFPPSAGPFPTRASPRPFIHLWCY